MKAACTEDRGRFLFSKLILQPHAAAAQPLEGQQRAALVCKYNLLLMLWNQAEGNLELQLHDILSPAWSNLKAEMHLSPHHRRGSPMS